VRWVSERPEREQGLAHPRCTIDATMVEHDDDDKKQERTLHVAIGQPTQGGDYAQHDGSDAVFVAPRGLALLASRWLLDRDALQFKADTVDKVSLSGRGKSLVVDRQGERWLVEGDPSSRAGDTIRQALEGLIAEAVLRLGAAEPSEGFGEPLLRIEITPNGGEPVVVSVGKGDVFRDTSVFYVRRSDLDATFAVAQSRLRSLVDAL